MSITLIWKKKPNADEIMARNFDETAMLWLHMTWYRLYKKYVPRDEGILEGEVEITSKYIRHKVPYAARQYYGVGFNFRTDKNALATAQWDLVADQLEHEKLARSIQNYIRRRNKTR